MLEDAGNFLKRVGSRLLARDGVFRAVQAGLRASMHARRALDRNVGRVLGTLDLPAQADVSRLADHVRALDARVGELTARLERVAETLERAGDGRGQEADDARR
jgi:ubiquinone biosynthesis protein UbiJ